MDDLHAGDQRRAFDQRYGAIYDELRARAARVRRRLRGVSISPTTLVHEAWVKLAGADLAIADPVHFKSLAAQAMRQILLDAARKQLARKRGGDVAFVTFDEAAVAGRTTAAEVVALDAALEQLARLDPRHARVVELRFFGGLDVAQTAAVLGVSKAVVERDWRAAKAWLSHALRSGS